MTRALFLAGASVAIFLLSVAVLLRLIPGPRSEGDYLIIGCLATLITLGALFLVLINTWLKIPNLFFKRRRKS